MRGAFLILFSSILLLSTVNPSFSMMIPNDELPPGLTTKKDFKPLAKAGHRVAQYKLGLLHLADTLTKPKGIKWLKDSANNGYVKAQTALGDEYLSIYQMDKPNGGGLQKDIDEAIRWFKMATKQWDPVAQRKIGWLYQNGLGVKRDQVQMMYWWRLSADQGDVDSLYNIGCSIHKYGVRLGVDLAGLNGLYLLEAVSSYGKSAKQGHLDSLKFLRELITLPDSL